MNTLKNKLHALPAVLLSVALLAITATATLSPTGEAMQLACQSPPACGG